MVAVLVRLRLTLLRNALRRSVWLVVGMVIGLVYALGAVVLAVAGLVALRWAPPDLTADITVLGFATVTAGWLLLSLLVFGVDETVDPARFALLPVRARQLMPGLLVSGLVSTAGAATAVVAVALPVAWSRGPAPLLASLVAVPIGVATCFLLSRAGTAAFAAVLASRRFRDLAFVGIALLAMVFGIGANLVGGVVDADPARLRSGLSDVATVAGWTPFGWIWTVPADVGAGRWGSATLRLVLALGLVALLWVVWGRCLDQRLTEPLEAVRGGGRVRAGGWVDRLFPATPAGAVAARTLRYWRRDPRYLAGVAGFLVGPVIVMITQLANPYGQVLVAVFAPALLCWLVGASLAQDLSYDGSAVWLHAASGVRGVDDRVGRVLSTSTVFGPLLVILTLVALGLTGSWDLWVPVVAVSVALVLAGLGVGAFVGTLWQWPAPPPGANPFQKGSSGGLPSLAAFGVTSLATLVLALPTVGLVIVSFWHPWLSWLALPVGAVVGGLTLWQGVVRGGAVLDRRWPEVLTATTP